MRHINNMEINMNNNIFDLDNRRHVIKNILNMQQHMVIKKQLYRH